MADMNYQSSVGLGDLVTVGKLSNQNMSQLIQAILGIFPRITGTVTLAAAATTTVPNTATAANTLIQLIPTNAAAATLVGGTKSPYVSARSPGVSFTIATASGVAAAGTETFSYFFITPV